MKDFYCAHCDVLFKAPFGWAVKCAKCGKPATPVHNVTQANQLQLQISNRSKALERQTWNEQHSDDRLVPEYLIKHMLSFLDEKGLALAGLVCRRWRPQAADLLRRFLPFMQGYGSMNNNLKNVLIGKSGLIAKTGALQLCVDQFPCPGNVSDDTILGWLLKNNVNIQLTLGTRDNDTIQLLEKAKKQVHLIDGFAKMHNKVWVLDKEGIVLGSPNVSFSGLEGGNLESFILIHSARLGALFSKYLRMLQVYGSGWKGEPKKQDSTYQVLMEEVTQALTAYNKEDHHLKVAMAPCINIIDFITENLKGAVKITLRQFLISPGKTRDSKVDILDFLCGLAKGGTEIEIVLDEGAFKEFDFVQQAAAKLYKAGCKVYTQKRVKVLHLKEGIMHDKLILATMHDGSMRTLIGSAGLTSHVIANENAETFICTDVPSVYNALMAHSKLSFNKENASTLSWKWD